MIVLVLVQGVFLFEGVIGLMFVNLQIFEDDVLLKNLNNVQLKNQFLFLFVFDSYDFIVEMEIGIGKMYVYFCIMFELNK